MSRCRRTRRAPRDASWATTPCRRYAGSARSACTATPLCSSARCFLYSATAGLQLRERRALGLADVPLHAEVAEHRGDRPEREIVGAPGGVRGGRSDVAADELRRQHGLGPALDGLALQRIVAVGGPHPVGALEDAEIHPGAPGGAALDLDPGMRGAQRVEQPVGGQRLRVRRRQPVVPHLGEVAVLVPLQVGDVVLAEQRVEPVVDVLPRLGVDQVEHLLLAPPRGDAGAGSADPVRVRARQVRVLVDHLRLHPEAELHAPRGHRLDERREAVRPDAPRPRTSRRARPSRRGGAGTSRRPARSVRRRPRSRARPAR